MLQRRTLAPYLLLTAIVAAGVALRFWRLGDLAVVGDESYYWLWSRHLAPGYYDNPGGVAWMVALSTWLGGASEVGVRWLNALLGSAVIPLAFALGWRLHSARAGLFAAALVAFSPPAIIVSRLVYTDALPLFLLALNLLLLAPLFTTPSAVPLRWGVGRWLAIGLTWVLMLNTKLSLYPYWPSLGLGLLLWRRDVLRERRFWLTALGALLGLLPFWGWNAVHQWRGVAWIWEQTAQGAIVVPSTLSALRHLVRYFSVPAVLLCSFGLLGWRERAGRWLLLVALPLLVPVLLSRADSPRNLLLGWLPLSVLSGIWLCGFVRGGRWQGGLVALLLGAAALYSVGTAVALVQPTPLPQSDVCLAIREDSAGMRDLGRRLRDEPGLVFTVDYSSASQLWYYSGRPIYTSWYQYAVWGIPDVDEVVLFSLDYIPLERINRRMALAFAEVEGPAHLTVHEYGMTKAVHLWRGQGRRVDKAEFVRLFDLFALHRATD